MRKEIEAPRFGPGHWVTISETGEHVEVESWSAIAGAYRVRSHKGGLQFVNEADLNEISDHPDVELGKYWRRCPAARCGAPLTPELAICPHCHAPTCTCGRCQCARKPRPKAKRKKVAAVAR